MEHRMFTPAKTLAAFTPISPQASATTSMVLFFEGVERITSPIRFGCSGQRSGPDLDILTRCAAPAFLVRRTMGPKASNAPWIPSASPRAIRQSA